MQDAIARVGVVLDLEYDQAHLEEQLSSDLGKQIRMHCNGGKLTELWMCVGPDLQLLDCPENISNQCATIELPSADEYGLYARVAHLPMWSWFACAAIVSLLLIGFVSAAARLGHNSSEYVRLP